MDINRILIAPYPAADMFALVDDIAAYPDFLPWCDNATVTRNGDQVTARLSICYRGIRTAFATTNVHMPPERITMTLCEGPLSSLTGEWRFIPLDDDRCRVELDLQYTFRHRALEKLFAALFSFIFDHFVDHFVARAKMVYGVAGRGKIAVELAHADHPNAPRRLLRLPVGATVADALAAADVDEEKIISIFGKPCTPQAPLNDGDRIEINRPLVKDPRLARRMRLQS